MPVSAKPPGCASSSSSGSEMRGRKRKQGKRERSGRLQRGPREPAPALSQPHRRGAKNPRDERLGYPLGRLWAKGDITELQHDAGVRFSGIVSAYLAIKGIPHPSLLGKTEGRSCRDDPPDDVIARIEERYEECMRALSETPAARWRVWALCINETYEPQDLTDLTWVMQGLDTITHTLGLTPRDKA